MRGNEELRRSVRVCMFGASPDTGNLGVSALWHSAVAGLAAQIDDLDLTVFDMSRGVRPASIDLGDRVLPYRRIGANHSRRIYRSDSIWNMRLATRLGGRWNAGVEAIRNADAVVDVSGGDSFADLYGERRFEAITAHKLLVLEQGRKLILLPQTYGPFRARKNRELASRIVRGAAMAWARDARSHEALRELLGESFDPTRHRCGVDMAFGLGSRPPAEPLAEPIRGWLDREHGEIVVGLNVSGLLYGRDDNRAQFGFLADYTAVIHDLVRRLALDDRVRVVLVPHVYGRHESDAEACARVVEAVGGAGGRVAALPGRFDQSEVKWIIAQLDWFCGTRMHSTIAALSSGVPVAAIAYSLKTQGVFETCGQGSQVADPRNLDTAEVTEALIGSFTGRAAAGARLAAHLPAVQALAQEQMGLIAACAAAGAVPVG